jgi:hypothetical protein
MFQHLIWISVRRGVAVVKMWAGHKLKARDVWIRRKVRGHVFRRKGGGWRKWQHQLTWAALEDIVLYRQQRWTEAIGTNMSKYVTASKSLTSTASLRQYHGQWRYERRYFSLFLFGPATLPLANNVGYSKSQLVRSGVSSVAYRHGERT